ncbi:MAG: hypothetical protein Q9174_004752, partial [Haloplaca sp. 1 TL-2023]
SIIDLSNLAPSSFITMAEYHITIHALTWCFLVGIIFSVLTRFVTRSRWSTIRHSKLEDILIVLATLLAIAQAITMTLQMRYWDRYKYIDDRYALYDSDVWGSDDWKQARVSSKKYMQAKYVETLVYIPCIFLSQAAMMLLLRSLAPVVRQRSFLGGVAGVLLIGGCVHELLMAFRCIEDDVQDFSIYSCYSDKSSSYWLSFWLWQLAFELLLVVLPWILIRRSQVNKYRKHAVCFCFATRLLVMIAIVVQMVIFYKEGGYDGDDVGFETWHKHICTPIVQGLGIITACLPYFRPFFDSVESAMIRSQEMRHGGAGNNEHSSAAPLPPAPSPAYGTWPAPKANREDIEMINRPAKSHGLGRTHYS